MRRHLAAAVAIVCLLTALAVWLSGWQPKLPVAEVSLRLGLVFAVVWLAFDQVQRVPTWLLFILPVMLLVLLLRAKWLLLAIPVLLVLALLRPRKHPR